MSFVRLNEKIQRPNEYVNWITVLPCPGNAECPSDDEAKQLLDALAAQVKPVMKTHGFTINSLEEVRV